MMWYDGGGWGWASWLLMSLVMLAVPGVLAWGAFLIWRATQENPDSAPPAAGPPTPEEILGERFARSEIEADEYRRRLEALRGDGQDLAHR